MQELDLGRAASERNSAGLPGCLGQYRASHLGVLLSSPWAPRGLVDTGLKQVASCLLPTLAVDRTLGGKGGLHVIGGGRVRWHGLSEMINYLGVQQCMWQLLCKLCEPIISRVLCHMSAAHLAPQERESANNGV